MNKMSVFIPLCIALGTVGHSSDEGSNANTLYQKSDVAVRQLHELFELRKTILDERVYAGSDAEEEAARKRFTAVKFVAAQIHTTYCLPLDSMFRNYFETFRLAALESPMKESAKLTLTSLLSEITGSFGAFCKIVDPCIVWN
jgi:hypothetical protein